MASALEKSLKARQGSTQILASASIKTNTATGGSALAKSIAARSAQTTPTLTTTAQTYASDEEKKRQEEEKNKGGVLGGIGYVGEKVGLGILQGVEGIFDYVGAGILDLFGADDAAEDVLENDWVNYSHADEWFNPGEGWKVAGDVGGGIGTSIPGLAAGVVAGIATGGASLVPTIAGLATSGLSAAGTSTKEAFQESGELGLKEFSYGAIMGGVEAGTEFLSGKIGAGILKNADDIAAAFGKTASKTAKAVSAKTIAASLGKEFASEAFEEGFAEFVSPYAKRLTYDPNAKNATIEEISYAALVGGLSGIVMGGGTTTITQTTNLARGSKAVDAGRVTSIMDTAKAFSDYEGTSPTKLSSMEAIRDLYTRLESQGVRESTKLTVNQRRAIGELQSLTTSAVFEPAMQKSAISAINGAEAIAQKLNADGQIKIVDGKMQAVTTDSLAELQKQGVEVRDITAEDIRGGVDVKDGKSVAKAMKENDLLRYIAASDVAGRFMMTAKEVETAARAGTKIKSQADLNAFIENASEEQKHALGAELGIADNEWATLKLKRFNEAAAAYRESGKLDAKRAEMQARNSSEKVLNSVTENDIINNKTEVTYEGTEGIRLRDSGERNGSQDPEGKVSRVESGAGQETFRTDERGVADGEAVGISYEGERVSAYDLGIPEGFKTTTVKRVSEASETSSMKAARSLAESRGLNLTFFADGNLSIKSKGKAIHARAYVTGNNVYVRADHTKYTADQLMRHEVGHDMIAKGEVDVKAVRKRLIKKVGEENVDAVAKAYADAYEGTGYTAEEIWEECICDSLGDMNIFSKEENNALMKRILPEIKKAASESKAPTKTRGSPEGKASRDIYWYPKLSQREWDLLNHRLEQEIETSDNYIDKHTKWLYADSRGVRVFAIYGIGDGTEPTVLYAVGGNSAKTLNERRIEYESNINRTERNPYKKRLNRIGVQQRQYGDGVNRNGQNVAPTNSRFGQVPSRTRGGDNRETVLGDGKQKEIAEKYSSPEEAKVSGKVSDAKFSIEFADDIADKQRKYAEDGLSRISSEELEKAIADTAHMVEEMKPYANILPQDKVGKTLVKNGSYDVSVENTTVCIRTLAYNSFVDMVSEKVGRPLTQMESFLVSQKLYEIAKEPQCLYCYVSLDRKAFNEMVIRYTEQRDAAIKAYEAAGKPKIPSKFDAEWSLFKEFLEGRKATTNMWDRYAGWLNAYNKGERLVSLADISTEAKRLELVESGGEVASQVKDILKYAQSASWAKKQTQYVAYYDEILKLKPAVIRKLNNHYGMRWYSFSDYSGAFIVENMQQITDAAIRGLKGLSYTKDTDFAEIFAPTGMNINISVYAKPDGKGGYEIDAKQSANIDEAIKLREQYPNVGIVVVATDKAGVEWALAQKWSDVVIPFHTVRTGADVAEFYNWEIFNAEQSDTVADQNLWDRYVNEVGKKKASKMVYPSEHQNNKDTYLKIIEERGLKPRFSSFLENPNYMKLVNETRQSESETSPLSAKFNLDAAERSFDKFVEKGGYYEGWYNDGIDVDSEADIVAEDVKAGKKANEVGYGRQDVSFDDVAKSRKMNRQHGKASAEVSDEFVSPTEGNVGLSRFEKADIKLGDKIKDTFTTTADKLYIDTVDELFGVEKYLKTRGKMKDANAFTQSVRAAETMAQTMIGVAQYDITDPSGKKLGDGLTKMFKKYKLRKIDGKFNDYLLHQLNVDRMTLEERSLAKQEELGKAFETAEAAYHRAKRLVDDGKRKTVPKDIWNAYRKAKSEYENYEVLKNKPVFGANEERAADITAEESRKIIAEFEKRYPEFKESAEAVWAYSRNLQAMRVAAGLLSQESADIMAEYYPHYVPSFRDKKGGVGSGTVKNDSQLAVNSTVKSAKGGGEDIFDVEESMAIQTRQTIKAIKMNQLANAVYDAAVSSGDTKYVLTAEAAERIENAGDDADIDIDIELTPKNNQIVFYRDGKKVAMNVSEEIFKGFKGVTEGSVPNSPLLQLVSKVLSGFKNLVTQYSPAFAARNFVRDMQDAMINTRHPKGFATHIKDALMGMVNNDADWQTYLAYGGFASTIFDAKGFQNGVDSRGFEELKKLSGISAKDFKSMAIPLQNIIKVIGNANSFIEQLTRFTEYKASIAAGDSIEVAINNSAEVTTNFSRHGTMVKKLNATVIPFLNASVQGFDKMLRVISGPFKEKSLTALAILLAKIVAIGITPQILNMIMNGDDEDYNDLTDEVKSNYFLIKVGDQFIKIPRGRLAGAFGGLANQLRNVSRGEGFDLAGYAESVTTNLTPVDSFSRDIFSPFRDVASNTTWYGGEIEGRQFDNVRPSQRYDESTSSIAIALGQAFNYSPKKIHYLLDQYSGVIGDFLLPATTKKAEKDYFSGNFLLDPKTNNKLSDQFYKLYDEAQYAKNEGDVTAIYQLKHLNDVKESVSELYDQITEIQRSDLSNTEKLQQTRVIRTLINNLYKTAKADYGAYTQAIEATAGVFDDSDASQQKLRHTVITQMMYGSEAALEQYNSDVYEKATLANKAGISYDLYYEYYFTTRDITSDYDKNGEVISGSKKEKTLKAIKALGVSANERLLLTALSGYSLTDAEKRRLLSIITRMNGTKEEKAALAEKCGFKVKNGRISMK